jgi:FGGY-family pentulose kinase
MQRLVCAVDVGTRSARAGIFDPVGNLLGRGEHPVRLFEPRPGHAEHNSQDIWHAVCAAVRAARDAAGVGSEAIGGISFDATCSLVVLDPEGNPLPVSADDEAGRDTIAWIDHRALGEAAECTATGDAVLQYAGGVMTPEMQVPKAMWLKRRRPDTWARIGYLFDLADFLTWRSTGNPARSICTLACKWSFLPHEGGWPRGFLAAVGLSDLIEGGNLPEAGAQVGSDLGPLTREAADALGLSTACRVGAGMVDAYAGGLGAFGADALSGAGDRGEAVLVAGTSSCVMTIGQTAHHFGGFWGPYIGVTLPGFWVTEGGQSATGALLDHIIRIHAAGGEPTAERHRAIADRISLLRREQADFAAKLHILPDFHGNRAPLADPGAVGVVSGLTLDASFDGLCRLYWRACVGIALGVRHILDHMRQAGTAIHTLHVTGGHTRNPLLMELYANATGCRLVEHAVDDSVLLGTAASAATAAGLFKALDDASTAMRQPKRERLPDPSAKAHLDRDYRVFQEMHRQRRVLEEIR